MITNNIFLRASVSLCVWVHVVFLLCSSTEPCCRLNERPLQRSDWWVLKMSAKCVLRFIDNNRAQPKEWPSRVVLVCLCVYMNVFVCACVRTQVERSKHLSCGWKCEIQEGFTATVDKVHTDMMSLSGNTYTLANTLKLSLKHTHARGHTRHGERIAEAGGWRRLAEKGSHRYKHRQQCNSPPSPLPPKKQIIQYTQTNTYAFQTNAHISFVRLSEILR